MKKLFLLLVALFIILYPLYKTEPQPINGLMIDCSRLLEKHHYYYELIDFMSEWDMNTLLLHFSDDHGISIELPGYEKLAHPHAFTRNEISDFVSYADQKGIDVIPEIEVFGHTRYITDHPDYQHLYVGDKNETIVFNALDPLNPKSIKLMQDMITQVSKLFPSPYIHLGCDEVNLSGLGLNNAQQEAKIWVNYVNTMIDIAHSCNKKPMIWSDHVRKDSCIAHALNKNVTLLEWNYSPEYTASGLDKLKEMGFSHIIMAPSISCWRNRLIPSDPQLKNVRAHATALFNDQAQGLINTMWLPMRYLQASMYYGIAYSAYLVNQEEIIDKTNFHKRFSRRSFGQALDLELNNFLTEWSELHLDRQYFYAIANNNYSILKNPQKVSELNKLKIASENLIKSSGQLHVKKQAYILDSMILTSKVVYVISEGLLIMSEHDTTKHRKDTWINEANKLIEHVEKDWDRGRFEDDPAKFEAKFPNQENSHILIILKKLLKTISSK